MTMTILKNYVRPVVAYPAIKQLARTDWRAALAIYREVMQAGPSVLHHDDEGESGGDDAQTHAVPLDEMSFENMADTHASAASNEGAHAEHRYHDRPSERDILRNIGWIEWPTTKPKGQPVGWFAPAGAASRPTFDSHRAYLGGLIFNVTPGLRKAMDGGQLISFHDGNGKPQRAGTGSTERGASRKRSKAAAMAYLKLPAAIPSPLAASSYQRPCESVLPPMYDPLPGKEEARAELVAMMAKTSVTVTTCPTVIAKGAHFFGGVSSGSGNKSTAAPIWDAPERRGLNHIIEEVAAGGDFADIGRAAGYSGKFTSNASHRGKTELLREAARIIERAAKDGKPLPMEPTAEQRARLDEWRSKERKGADRMKMLRAANDNNPQQQRRVA